MTEITQNDLEAIAPAIEGVGIPALGEVKLKFAAHLEQNEKGIQVWIVGEDRPMKGYPHPLICHPVWVWKRGFLTIIRILTSPWAIMTHLERYADIIQNYATDPAKLSISMRYVYFALLKTLPKYPSLCWATAVWIDYDDSYRYACQITLSKLDKEGMKKSPRKELHRLIDGYLARQEDEYTRNKMLTMKRLLSVALCFPRVKLAVRVFAESLDIEKVALDEDDLYWANKIDGFDFS